MLAGVRCKGECIFEGTSLLRRRAEAGIKGEGAGQEGRVEIKE